MAASTRIITKRLSSFYSLFYYHHSARLGHSCIRQASGRSRYFYKPLTPLEKSIKELKKARNPLTGDKRLGRDFNYNMELSTLATRLGHALNRLPSLRSALIHESALHVTDMPTTQDETTPTTELKMNHNSNLIILGETSLSYFCRTYIIKTYPNLRPRMVTGILEHLLSIESLNKLSRYLGVANLLVTSEEPSDEVFAKTVTAVFGAVKTDLGNDAVSKLIKDFVLSNVQDVELRNTLQFTHPRLLLRHVMTSQGREWPVARLIKETGRLTHFPTFIVGVYVGGFLIGEGAGSSLKRAQNEAASAALRDHFLSRVKYNKKKVMKGYRSNVYEQSSPSVNNSEVSSRQQTSTDSTDSQIMTG